MTGVLIKTVRGIFDFRKATCLRAVIVNPVSIAEQSHITQSLLGTGIIASYLVLVELGNSDSSKDADDRNYDQQFDEGEAFCTFVSWMFLYKQIHLLSSASVFVTPVPLLYSSRIR